MVNRKESLKGRSKTCFIYRYISYMNWRNLQRVDGNSIACLRVSGSLNGLRPSSPDIGYHGRKKNGLNKHSLNYSLAFASHDSIAIPRLTHTHSLLSRALVILVCCGSEKLLLLLQ